MISKAIYSQSLHEKLDGWDDAINRLKDQADHAVDSDAKAEFNGQIEEIHALKQVALEKLAHLEYAEETSWEHFKEEIEYAWGKLEAAVKLFIAVYK